MSCVNVPLSKLLPNCKGKKNDLINSVLKQHISNLFEDTCDFMPAVRPISIDHVQNYVLLPEV
jgi:hypothetical protein